MEGTCNAPSRPAIGESWRPNVSWASLHFTVGTGHATRIPAIGEGRTPATPFISPPTCYLGAATLEPARVLQSDARAGRVGRVTVAHSMLSK
jgi:hypothetical protein